MEKVKTLIDIQLLNCNLEEANRVGHLNWFRKELKTEATNWIKELEKNSKILCNYPKGSMEYDALNMLIKYNMKAKIDFIKYFFNITQKDIDENED